MHASLPRSPSLAHLKKQAKQLLAAQRAGVPQSCRLLRRLHRFTAASDQEILSARVTLAEAQFVLAMHYGFRSWSALKDAVGAIPPCDQNSLEAVTSRSEKEIPVYAGAGVPLAVVAALNHAGIEIAFMEFAAASGWAFSFGYQYDRTSPAQMAVRGDPDADGPFEVFSFLPGQLGLGYDMARTGDPEELWRFVTTRVDAGTPIMSEHMDGGLISAYREVDDRRELFFDGTVAPGWIDVGSLQPHAVYSFVRRGDPAPEDQVRVLALGRAVAKGKPHSSRGIPQGQAALRSYLSDVSDVTRDFSSTEEWFCWAAFQRLMARRCCEVWLRAVARHLSGGAAAFALAAADHYGDAFSCYDQYRSEVQAGQPPRRSLQERARTPERIATIIPILERGMDAEAAGLASLEHVLGELT
jgi:hypothetical protein